MGITRRQALIAGVSGAFGAGAALGADKAVEAYEDSQPLQFYGGHASLLEPDPTQRVASSGRVVWAGETKAKALALTFDDGPMPDWTPRVLHALDDADVPATFFCRGDHVTKYGSIHKSSLKRHEIGNHTWDHPDLGRADFASARSQLERTTSAIHDAYGLTPTLFRPPYGHVGGAAIAAAASMGMTTVAWSAQFREAQFRSHPDDIVDDIASLVHPGAIILGHDCGSKERLVTIDRLPRIIDRLKHDGWSFHTVSGLLALKA